MSATISLTGFVATKPKYHVTDKGVQIASFRLGTSERRQNRQTGVWESGPVSWFTVTCFRYLALNVFASVHKGQPVVVAGRLRVRDWEAGDKTGVDVEVEAEAVGLDLTWGKVDVFERNKESSGSAAQASGTAGAAAADAFPSDSAYRTGLGDEAISFAAATSLVAGEPLEALEGADELQPEGATPF